MSTVRPAVEGAETQSLRLALHEDRRTLSRALWMEALAERGAPEAVLESIAKVDALFEYEIEQHFEREETELYPPLAKRGLAREVGEAKSQHAEIKRLGAELRDARGDAVAARAILRQLARSLKEHCRYEAAFLFVGLQLAEVDEYVRDIDDALKDAIGG